MSLHGGRKLGTLRTCSWLQEAGQTTRNAASSGLGLGTGGHGIPLALNDELGHEAGREDLAPEALLLQQLAARPGPARSARYQCVIVFVRQADDPAPLICRGSWEGSIITAPRGSGGFGYDSVFLPAGLQHTAAELSAADKNLVSHRGQALRALIAMLRAPGYIPAP